MNEMHEKWGAGIRTSGVSRTEGRIGGGNSRKRPRGISLEGSVRVSPTTIGGPDWKNGWSVDQKTRRTGIATTIGGRNWKNGRPVDQKTRRTGIATTIGGPKWKNGRPVDQETRPTTIGTTIGGANWKNGRPVDQKALSTGIGTPIGGPKWKTGWSVDQKARGTGIGTPIGGPNWKTGRRVDQTAVRRKREGGCDRWGGAFGGWRQSPAGGSGQPWAPTRGTKRQGARSISSRAPPTLVTTFRVWQSCPPTGMTTRPPSRS